MLHLVHPSSLLLPLIPAHSGAHDFAMYLIRIMLPSECEFGLGTMLAQAMTAVVDAGRHKSRLQDGSSPVSTGRLFLAEKFKQSRVAASPVRYLLQGLKMTPLLDVRHVVATDNGTQKTGTNTGAALRCPHAIGQSIVGRGEDFESINGPA
jgi:hypothetical protein